MRYRTLGLLAFGLALTLSGSAHAADKKEKPKDEKAEHSERKDPKGITGIRPYTELIIKGNAAYVAGDYATATSAYQEATQKTPNNALGHYMLGQAYVANNQLEEAARAWQTALRNAGKKPALKAKVLFVIADLHERQQKFDKAAKAWKAYAGYVAANQSAKGYPASARQRQATLEKRKAMGAQYAKVKERIAQREKDAAAKAKP